MLAVTIARSLRRNVAALAIWAEICEMRRTQAQEKCDAI
jgi:hypothetical protein